MDTESHQWYNTAVFGGKTCVEDLFTCGFDPNIIQYIQKPYNIPWYSSLPDSQTQFLSFNWPTIRLDIQLVDWRHLLGILDDHINIVKNNSLSFSYHYLKLIILSIENTHHKSEFIHRFIVTLLHETIVVVIAFTLSKLGCLTPGFILQRMLSLSTVCLFMA